MKVSSSKSLLTLVTPYNIEYTPQQQVTLSNTALPITSNNKILGVTFDRDITFKFHVENTNTKPKTDRKSSASSPTQLTTLPGKYNNSIQTRYLFYHDRWTHCAAPHSAKACINKLHNTKNTVLRIATGCTRTTLLLIHFHVTTYTLSYYFLYTSSHFPHRYERHAHALHTMQNPTQTRRNIH